MKGFALGQRVRILAEAETAYDEIWYRSTDAEGRPVRESYPNFLADGGYECVHRPNGERREGVKCLWRRPFSAPREGTIIGRTWRATGHHELGDYDYGSESYRPPTLVPDRRFTIYEVALSLKRRDRAFVLAEDVEALS